MPKHLSISTAGVHYVHPSRLAAHQSKNRLSEAPASICDGHLALAIQSETDPFLLLDDFRNDIPEDYLAGFPWHPHRGIETITYVLAGEVDHADSIGNSGAIGVAEETSSG